MTQRHFWITCPVEDFFEVTSGAGLVTGKGGQIDLHLRSLFDSMGWRYCLPVETMVETHDYAQAPRKDARINITSVTWEVVADIDEETEIWLLLRFNAFVPPKLPCRWGKGGCP